MRIWFFYIVFFLLSSVLFSQEKKIDSLALMQNQLNEIIVKSSIVDLANERKTPVAVSTIKAAEIQEKLGNQEFPEILKNTPSVYITKSGGGFGDARVSIRGFSQENVAVMVNGIPVNEMENSRVFWSNWAALADVTSVIQIQRGLGSSKLAISSVGGTINVLTRAADCKQGGVVASTYGNDNYLKTVVSYNTGKMKNDFSASFLLSNNSGDGYVDATDFKGNSYYIALGYASKSGKHTFQFTYLGEPQSHNQRVFAPTIETYLQYGSSIKPNTKYNAEWGFLNGEQFTFSSSSSHKPLASFNWDWKINKFSSLSAVLYASKGNGGGVASVGGIRGKKYSDPVFKTNGYINVDAINQWNEGRTIAIDGKKYTRLPINGDYQNSNDTGINKVGNSTIVNNTSGISKINSQKSHDWYGGIIKWDKIINTQLVLDCGLDIKTYKGNSYQSVNNLLGGTNFNANYTTSPFNNDINNPIRILTSEYDANPQRNPFFKTDFQDKINYNIAAVINWFGVFSQLEYSNKVFTTFVQGALSQQGFKREDYFQYLTTNPLFKTNFKSILGGNIKSGVNYNLSKKNNVFFNAGFYSKQPNFSAIYPNKASVLGQNIVNEKITDFEVGYGFRSKGINIKAAIYHTIWRDRYLRSTDFSADNIGGYYDFTGITEVHSGIELEANTLISHRLKINTMFSLGDWKYAGNSSSKRYDVSNIPMNGGTATTLYLDKVEVGDAAQLTCSLGVSYKVFDELLLDANYNYYDRLYAFISPTSFSSSANKGSLELPSYGLMDAGISYKIVLSTKRENALCFRLNINNVFDTVYIAESKDNIFTSDYVTGTSGPTYQSSGKIYRGVATSNKVFFGFGQTWNFTFRYIFI